MANVLEKIGDGIETAAKDVAKGVVAVVEFLPKAEAVIATAIKDDPTVKAAVVELVQQAVAVIGDVSEDAASKGIDLASDAKTLSDAEAFFNYFRTTWIPMIESIYTEVKADIAD